MARLLRPEFPKTYYHITTRGNNKENIFLFKSDYYQYLNKLAFYKQKYDFKLFAYCLMPNHVHLFIKTPKKPSLSKIMHSLNTSYTVWFKNKYQFVGHVFQGRYKSLIVDYDSYFVELTRYIHLNPIRANLTTDLERYLYSSFHAYLGRYQVIPVDTEEILGRFGKRATVQRRKYRSFVMEKKPKIKKLETKITRQIFLGDEKFAKKFLKTCSKGVSGPDPTGF